MAVTITAYNHLSEIVFDGTLGDLAALTAKAALVDSGYTFDATDTQWADVSANEVASGDGYTTGGETVGSLALTRATATTKLDGADVTWTALTKDFRFMVVYAEGTFGALTNPLLFCVLFDDTPADVSVSGIDFVGIWAAAGILHN